MITNHKMLYFKPVFILILLLWRILFDHWLARNMPLKDFNPFLNKGKAPMSKDFVPKQFTTDYYCYESGQADISVVDRLKSGINYVTALGFSSYYMSIATIGYIPSLLADPPKKFFRNNKSSRDNPVFVRTSIDDLIQTNAVDELPEPAFLTLPLTVADKNGKKRLVIDLSFFNDFLGKMKFKYENLLTLIRYIELLGYMLKFDLKSGFHHIPINKAYRKYFGFSYTDYTGCSRFFQFKCMPFGLSTATRFF